MRSGLPARGDPHLTRGQGRDSRRCRVRAVPCRCAGAGLHRSDHPISLPPTSSPEPSGRGRARRASGTCPPSPGAHARADAGVRRRVRRGGFPEDRRRSRQRDPRDAGAHPRGPGADGEPGPPGTTAVRISGRHRRAAFVAEPGSPGLRPLPAVGVDAGRSRLDRDAGVAGTSAGFDGPCRDDRAGGARRGRLAR